MRQRVFYCPVCGGALVQAERYGRLRLVCSKCGRVNFENPIVGVAGIVCNERNEVLLVRRAKEVTYPGLWCIPCGYLEYDEDVRVGMVREMREETGLVVEPQEVFAVHSNFHNPEQQTVGIWFKTKVLGGILQAGDDADAVLWIDPANPPPLAFPTDREVLRALAAALPR